MKQGYVAYIVLMLSASVTPAMFLLAPQVAYKFGMWGIIAFTGAGLIAFPIYSLILNRLQMDSIRPSFISFVQLLFLTESLTGLFLVAKTLWFHIFKNNDLTMLFTIFAIFITLEIILWRNQHYKLVTVSVVVLGMISSFLIPTLVYLNIGIPVVYNGLHYLSQDSIRLGVNNNWMLLVVFVFSIFHFPFVFFHGERFVGNHEKSYLSYLLPALLWSSLPIALGSLAFVAKAHGLRVDDADHVGLAIVERFGGQFGKMLFLVSILAVMGFSLLRINDQMKKTKSFMWKGIAGLCISLAIVFGSDLTLFETFLRFGIIQGSIIPILLMGNRKVDNQWVPFLVAVSAAIWVSGKNPITGIMVGLITSFMAGVLIYLWNHQKRRVQEQEHS